MKSIVGKFSKVSFSQFKQDYLEFIDGHCSDELLHQIYDDISLPQRSTKYSAGYDFKLPIPKDTGAESWFLNKDKSITIPTGIRVQMYDSNWVLMLYPRSGIGFKHGVKLANTVGVIDADYINSDNEGHILVKMIGGHKPLPLTSNMKFVQGVFLPYGVTVDDCATETRNGGIGSTDINDGGIVNNEIS